MLRIEFNVQYPWCMDDVDFWVNHLNARGHAGRGHTTHQTHQIVELSILGDWQTAVAESLGWHVSDLKINPSDPPDAFATIEGRRVSIELTELVDGRLLSGLRRASRASGIRMTSSEGDAFIRSQWTQERFRHELRQRIEAKQKRYDKRDIVIDVLVIFTDEPWLSRLQVAEWLKDWLPMATPNLKAVHLLMGYEPGYPAGYPVFELS
jgi:hypothetical protein